MDFMGKKAQIKREKIERTRIERKHYIETNVRSKYPWLYFWQRADFWISFVAFVAIVVYPFVPEKYLISSYYSDTVATSENQLSNTATLTTTMGEIKIAFYEDDAPKTVENFKKLAGQGFYTDLLWHRVIKEFMIQTGDPSGDGTGGPGYQFEDEINGHKIDAGTVAMANSGPNTNGSQFFIVTDQPQPHLDGKHTVFGYVVEGMEVVKLISEVPTDESDKPLSPIKLINVSINE